MNFRTFVAPVAALTLLISGVVSTQEAKAGYTCRTDYFGNQNCSGSINGQNVNTNTRRDYFGNTTTTGTVGGSSFNQSCRTDYFGNTNCY